MEKIQSPQLGLMSTTIGALTVISSVTLLRTEKMFRITEEQIRELIDHLIDEAKDNPKWPSTTYAEGVQAALEWVIGDSDDHPLDLQCEIPMISEPIEDRKNAK